MANTPLYQESLLHMAMAGAKRFLWFRWSGDLLPEDGTGSSLLYGIHKANCVMAEADVVVVSQHTYISRPSFVEYALITAAQKTHTAVATKAENATITFDYNKYLD